MAKLGAYYALCPLSDHRSLQGISPDKKNGVVIVTLRENMAIKFRLSDQRQLYSWGTKHKFGSPVIYDKQQSHYVAAFNESFIRTWKGDEEFSDKLRKFKFNQQIHTLFVCNNKSFIVFRNGNICLLNEAIERRRELTLDPIINTASDYIVEVLYNNTNDGVYVGLIVKSNENNYLYWTKFQESNQQEKVSKILLERDNSELNGYVFHVDKMSVNFLSLWSDGRIYSTDLKEDPSNIGELFAVIESISCKEYVSMKSLDQNYIALYGCNSNEEGALLVIFNVQFKVVQSKQPFKLFTNGAKLWRIDENLFFPVRQNLALIPFYLDLEQLAALVGSHKVVESNPDTEVTIVQKVQLVNWGKGSDSLENNVPELLQSKINDFVAQGLPKNIIFETLLSDASMCENVEILKQAINYFTDVSENSLVKVIKLILNLDAALFNKSTKNSCTYCPEKLQPFEKAKLLDVVLSKSFNVTLLLSYLRFGLSVDEILLLLQYIYYMLSEDGHSLPSHSCIETEAKLIEWCCILLDASYQKLLVTRDDKVNEILVSLRDFVKEELSYSEDLLHTASLLYEIKNGKSVQKRIHMSAVDYTIEEFPLY